MIEAQPLVVEGITRQFKTEKGLLTAVDHVSFSLAPGSVHGLLGPNGAGKSTLIAMISGMLAPTTGVISVFGHDVVRETVLTKEMLGVVPQELVVEMAFTVREVLYYFSGLYGVPVGERNARIDAVLKDLDLSDKAEVKARTLSGGMKRRLMIAKAILHRPRLLILDEPTAGVDVALRQKIWELVRRLNQEGTTILFTTHYLEEAEQLCERITLVDHGRIIKDGPLRDLQREFSRNTIHFELFDANVPHLEGVKPIGVEFELPLQNMSADMARLTAHYQANLKAIRSETASLESIFLTLTK